MGFKDKFKNIFGSGDDKKSKTIETKQTTSMMDDPDNIAMNHLKNLIGDDENIVIDGHTIRYVGDSKSEQKNDGDSIYGDAFEKGFRKLNKLIHSGEKTIVLDEDIDLQFDETSKFFYGIDVDVEGIVIDGAGHTINAQSKTRIFNVTADNVTIKNMVLESGHSEKGGAIFNESDNLTLMAVAFNSNSGDSGAAICNVGTMVMKNCLMLANSTQKEGGAITNDGGANMENCQFKGNTSKYGGAISHGGNNLTLKGCNFIENIAAVGGGAVISAPNSMMTIDDCIFESNGSVSVGGALDIIGNLNLSKSRFINNKAGKGGAVMSFEISVFDINECIFESNEVTGIGGAIYVTPGASIKITQGTFNNNVAKEKGGAIIGFNDDDVTLTRCTFNNNKPNDIN